jgi:type I restriction enzyme M protein
MAKDTSTPTKSNGANLGFETDLWRAADTLRSNMDAAEYKRTVQATASKRASCTWPN